MEISCSNLNFDIVIRAKFWTWYDSCGAVLACTKFCTNRVTRNWIIAKHVFLHIWITNENLLAKSTTCNKCYSKICHIFVYYIRTNPSTATKRINIHSWQMWFWMVIWCWYIIKWIWYWVQYQYVLLNTSNHNDINTWRPSGVYVLVTWSLLVQVRACNLFSAKPIPEPVLTYCQLGKTWCHKTYYWSFVRGIHKEVWCFLCV